MSILRKSPHSKKGLHLLIVGMLWVVTPFCSPGPQEGRQKKVVAVVPKGTTHIFWKSVEEGARRAAADFDLEMIWKGPLKENDRADQIRLVEQLVTQRVDGIVLAPLDEVALLRPVRDANSGNIPVVIFDTALQGEPGKDFVSFVATNNYAAGRLAAEEMIRLLGGEGQVGILRYQSGSGSTMRREEGFLASMREAEGIEVILENQYAGVTVGSTIRKTEELLDDFRRLDGIFCPTEPTTSGVLIALRKHRLTGELRVIGFDSSEELRRALSAGEIDALILQQPEQIGYRAVEVMARHLRGEKVPPLIDLEARVLGREIEK